jgi:CubicO group peptidase (beta-lactamase class C family)
MNGYTLDKIARGLAKRGSSRRDVLRGWGAALAAVALKNAGIRRSAAAQATPVADLSTGTPQILTGEMLASFEAFVAEKLAGYGVVGASVALVQNGEVVFLKGFGVGELGKTGSVTADTLFRIGSVTKSFSSLMAATLVDEGRMNWDTPIVELLPDFAVSDPALTPKLTESDAFCACTGLPRRDLEIMFNADELTREQLVADVAKLPLVTDYGTTFAYNNQLVAVGGYAAAVAGGGAQDDLAHAYEVVLREQVLNPIDMKRTTLSLDDVLADGDYSSPHSGDISGMLQVLPLLTDTTAISPVDPSGGLWSSAREMARYLQTELNRGINPDGSRVVSAENLERTWQPGVQIQAAPAGIPADIAAFLQNYALGWMTGNYRGRPLVTHGGDTFGFSAYVTFLPDADAGIVVLTNSSGPGSLLIYSAIFRFLELIFNQPQTTDAELIALDAAGAKARAEELTHIGEIDESVVTPYLGDFTNPDIGNLTVSLRGGKLNFDVGEFHSELRPLLDDSGATIGYLCVDAPLATFAPPMIITLPASESDIYSVVLTVTTEPVEPNLVYTFTPVA